MGTYVYTRGQVWASLILLGATHAGFMYVYWRFFYGHAQHYGHVLASHGFGLASMMACSTAASLLTGPERVVPTATALDATL